MIAEQVCEDAPVAPLFAAMATEIQHQAAQIGQASPSPRLDPPLLMGLDEVTQIYQVPLSGRACESPCRKALHITSITDLAMFCNA